MQKKLLSGLVAAAVLGIALPVAAQNLAIVNGKPVPKARAEALKQQVERSGRPITPEIEAQIKEEVIAREVFMQEAKKRNLEASADYKAQMELARQSILIRELFADYQKKNPVTDAEIKAEYDKFVAANNGKEYKASHILVEKEEEAKAIIKDLDAGKDFIEIAKENKVSVIRTPPFARALYHHAELGEEIPSALYTAAAEVLAYIYQLKQFQRVGGTEPALNDDLPVPKELDPEAAG